jgi:hypothetical protein
MKFRNYCIVVLRNIDGALLEIESVSDTKPNLLILEENNVLVVTFTSLFTLNELRDYFKSGNRNILLFELNETTCTYNFNDKNITETLFSFLNVMTNDKLDDRSDAFIKLVKTSSRPELYEEFIEFDTDKYNINNLSKDKREMIINKILDAGVNNMTDYDKTLLNYLTNIK